MTRSVFPLALCSLAFWLGCGQSSDPPGQPTAQQAAQQSTPDSAEVASDQRGAESAARGADGAVPSPVDVVSQFLDRVRRGGEDSGAGDLLTARAQAELKRIGRTVQPIGSPDAHFEVTRSEAVPEEEDSRLVHSIWSEPAGDGEPADLQVVWALQREPAGWRISGLAMELQPGAAPTVIDFENGELMAKLLAEPNPDGESGDDPAATDPETSQATAPDETAVR